MDRGGGRVVGGDYTTGPFKLGVSYMDRTAENFSGANNDMDTTRYSGGVTYTSDSGGQSNVGSPGVGHERNGVFFS